GRHRALHSQQGVAGRSDAVPAAPFSAAREIASTPGSLPVLLLSSPKCFSVPELSRAGQRRFTADGPQGVTDVPTDKVILILQGFGESILRAPGDGAEVRQDQRGITTDLYLRRLQFFHELFERRLQHFLEASAYGLGPEWAYLFQGVNRIAARHRIL